ncbi:hypothetical protein C4D60_Mb08t23890 [Musa balbisiana]|uniref:RING-type E3 ubiquitin transferase n=1 Tax=Musa balbisiana TaxID=52838 RepID=A0A4S8K630_MUSBA|nr:hypothetical protein C4D60_Mb08t23890 [Musa balbisiana]
MVAVAFVAFNKPKTCFLHQQEIYSNKLRFQMEIELYFLCAMDLKKLSRTHVNPHSPPLHTHHCWSCPENNNNIFFLTCNELCLVVKKCRRWLPCSGSRPERLVLALGSVIEVVSPLTSHLLDKFQSDSVPSESSPSSRMSPAVLFIIVVLAVLLFISGLLHFILRCFIRKRHPRPSSSRAAPELSGSDALQQLFHLHDSGVDQALIDALPVFLYKAVVGSKEPLDCAVCLCEFDGEDELRLLPVCGHAFHLSCIDTWLLSNSTCPLCRGSLFLQGMAVEDPVFDLGDSTDEGEASPAERAAAVAAAEGDEIAADRRRVFHVRLGKFRNLGNGNVGGDCDEDNSIAIGSVRREVGETSSSSLTARRCFSMGSYQYVVADAQLQVALNSCSALRNGDGRGIRGTDARGNSPGNEAVEGKRLSIGSRHESFSVSKVWLWSNKKGKVSMSSDTSALDTNSPWKTEAVGLKVTGAISQSSARSKSEGPTSTACAVEGAAVDVPVAAAAAVLLCPTRKNKTGNTAPKIAAVDDHVPDKSLPIELKRPSSSVFSASSLAGIIHSTSQEKHTKNLPHGKTISTNKKIAAQYKCKGPLRNPISPHKKSGKEISSHLDNGNEIRYKLLLTESRSSSSPLCVTSTEWGSIPSLLPSNTVSTVYPLSNFISGRWPETAAGNAGGLRDHNLFSREEAALEAALETATPTISTRPKQQENELVMQHRKAKKEQNTHLQMKRLKQSCTHPARSQNCLRCMKHLKSFNREDGKEEGLNLVSKQRPSECTDSTKQKLDKKPEFDCMRSQTKPKTMFMVDCTLKRRVIKETGNRVDFSNDVLILFGPATSSFHRDSKKSKTTTNYKQNSSSPRIILLVATNPSPSTHFPRIQEDANQEKTTHKKNFTLLPFATITIKKQIFHYSHTPRNFKEARARPTARQRQHNPSRKRPPSNSKTQTSKPSRGRTECVATYLGARRSVAVGGE